MCNQERKQLKYLTHNTLRKPSYFRVFETNLGLDGFYAKLQRRFVKKFHTCIELANL